MKAGRQTGQQPGSEDDGEAKNSLQRNAANQRTPRYVRVFTQERRRKPISIDPGKPEQRGL
jgi:hypothetical protein